MKSLKANYPDLGNPKAFHPEATLTDIVRQGFNFENDGHINEDGHRFVANAIFSWIRANLPEL